MIELILTLNWFQFYLRQSGKKRVLAQLFLLRRCFLAFRLTPCLVLGFYAPIQDFLFVCFILVSTKEIQGS